MQRLIIRIISVCLILTVLLLGGCSAWDKTKRSLDKTRPEEALSMPDFSGDITDVRVQAVKRDGEYYGSGNLDGYDYQLMQIYYGYCYNGEWHDIPCENYDLRGILSNDDEAGYNAAGDHHIVKIGNYLLVALGVRGNSDSSSVYGEVSDSLGSEIIELTEYYTPGNFENADDVYIYLKEDIRNLDTDDFQINISLGFGKWYFVLLEYDKIPADYELVLRSHAPQNGFDNVTERVLTYNDIQSALNSH